MTVFLDNDIYIQGANWPIVSYSDNPFKKDKEELSFKETAEMVSDHLMTVVKREFARILENSGEHIPQTNTE